MSAYANSVASVYANVCADVHNTCLTYTSAHAWCSQHLLKCMHTLRKKITCTRACAPLQQCSNFFAMEAIANLSWVLREHRAGCCLPPTRLLSPRNQLPDAVRSRNPSTSKLIHDAVAAAVSHKHHSIIRRWWLVQSSSILSMVRTRNVAIDVIHQRILFLPSIRESFFIHIYADVYIQNVIKKPIFLTKERFHRFLGHGIKKQISLTKSSRLPLYW